MKNQNIIIPILVAIIVGVVGFFGGMQYQKAQVSAPGAQLGNGATGFASRGRLPRGSGAPNGGAVIGQVLSASNNTLTVKLPDGTSKIVVLPSNVAISKMAPATSADLTTGTNIAVFGTTNSDGSITAQNVQLNPMFRGPARPMPSGSPTNR